MIPTKNVKYSPESLTYIILVEISQKHFDWMGRDIFNNPEKR